MIRKNTWLLLSLFAALLLLMWYLQREPGEEPVAVPTPFPTQSFLLDISSNEVVGIRIKGASGIVEFAKAEDESWILLIPDTPPEETDMAKLEQAASQAASIQVLTQLPSPPSLKAMGLDTPAYTLTFTLQNGEVVVVYIGDKTPVGTGYYASVEGKLPVVVATFSVDPFLDFLQVLPVVTPTATLEETPRAETTATPES